VGGVMVVGAEDVLLRPHEDAYASSSPIDRGCELVSAISHGMLISSLVVLFNTPDEQAAHFWTRLNGFSDAQLRCVEPGDINMDAHHRQWAQIQRQRAMGPIWMVVTASSTVARLCQESFQDVVLFVRRGQVEGVPELVTWETARQLAVRSRIERAEEG